MTFYAEKTQSETLFQMTTAVGLKAFVTTINNCVFVLFKLMDNVHLRINKSEKEIKTVVHSYLGNKAEI